MMETRKIWFPEPRVEDPTYARRMERTTEWLRRSTVSRAAEYRRFLNNALNMLPDEAQGNIYNALIHRWGSAFFELIAARTLQVLGATITIEESLLDGKRPDFTAYFPDQTVIVEAISPIINASLGEEAKRRARLLDVIEAYAPDGWFVDVETLPDIGLSDSLEEFKIA